MLEIRESYVNETKGYRFGESDWYEPFTDDIGKLYRSLQSEYGRCISKVYVDDKNGKPRACGWVFEKRMEYDDAHRMTRSENKTYIRQVWVTYRTVAETYADDEG